MSEKNAQTNGRFHIFSERVLENFNKREKIKEKRKEIGRLGGLKKAENLANSTKTYQNVPKESKEKESKIKEIVEYLNLKSEKNYKYGTQKTIDCINARLNEGFTVDEFKKVIDIKCTDWLNDEENNLYLRPETLFGNKFEGYLNQNGSIKKDGKIVVNLDE